MSADHTPTLRCFYDAFTVLDADTMAACYAPDAGFDDEVFSLRGRREIGSMWKMLCSTTREKGADVWCLRYRDVQADDRHGSAHWDAHYRFSTTGRIVDNRIDAAFTFTADGLIATHRDRFDVWSWSRQALGAPGLLLGWTPMLRKKIRATAAENLTRWMESHP